MKSARDGNTVNTQYGDYIYRVFLDGKLFISDGDETCFNSLSGAVDAVINSAWWRNITQYVDYSQKFFNKEGDDNWRLEFIDKILKNINLEYREYKYDGIPIRVASNAR